MTQSHWTLNDIPWDKFDASKVDGDILRAVKAAALVEHNAWDYVTYLKNVFNDDPDFQAAAQLWGEEEIQHGQALARWASLADPSFNFDSAMKRFAEGYQLPLDATQSVRGSRTGELIARCVVEVGTSSYYSAIRDASDEPVLKAICHKIAGDEFRHYKLFFDHYRRYQTHDPLPLWRRLMVAFGRVQEASDDELAMAYWCGNAPPESYDRKRHSAAYALRAGRLYRPPHLRRALSMIFKACDLNPQSRWVDRLAAIAWRALQWRNRRLARLIV